MTFPFLKTPLQLIYCKMPSHSCVYLTDCTLFLPYHKGTPHRSIIEATGVEAGGTMVAGHVELTVRNLGRVPPSSPKCTNVWCMERKVLRLQRRSPKTQRNLKHTRSKCVPRKKPRNTQRSAMCVTRSSV